MCMGGADDLRLEQRHATGVLCEMQPHVGSWGLSPHQTGAAYAPKGSIRRQGQAGSCAFGRMILPDT